LIPYLNELLSISLNYPLGTPLICFIEKLTRRVRVRGRNDVRALLSSMD
jgi:hypothetical protein